MTDTLLGPAVGAVGFNRIVAPRFLGRPCDEAAVRTALDETLPPILAYLETQAGDEWLVGDALTLADISVASGLVNLHHAGEAPDPTRYPALTAWYDRIVGPPLLRRSAEGGREDAGVRTGPKSGMRST